MLIYYHSVSLISLTYDLDMAGGDGSFGTFRTEKRKDFTGERKEKGKGKIGKLLKLKRT